MILPIISILALLVLSAIARWLTSDWLHPATVFCSLWACVCVLAILIAPENVTSASAPLWILLNCILVVAGGLGGTKCAGTTYGQRAKRRALGSSASPVMTSRWLRISAGVTFIL